MQNYDFCLRRILLLGSVMQPIAPWLGHAEETELPRFTDVAESAGLSEEAAKRVVFADLDSAVGRSLARPKHERRAELGRRPGLWRNDGGNRNTGCRSGWSASVRTGGASGRVSWCAPVPRYGPGS